MAAKAINAIDRCKACLTSRKSFVLQGGAGSGKTESLKELLLYIKTEHPEAKVICITHTNAAVDEIVSRVGERYPISTIHSFLYGLIGHYKKNIKSVISELFLVPEMIRAEQMEKQTDADYKKAEHEKYKKIYEKYSANLYRICKENSEKVTGKREYDKEPEKYNDILNRKIQLLNKKILDIIENKEYSSIYYNQTKFDALNDLSYGHDGLLILFHKMFEKYPLLGKIIADKYDYVFVDEYQDTRKEVLCDILKLSEKYGVTIGLFGDSMQSIYDDGVENLDSYINDGILEPILKQDNFRCSYEVLKVINTLRLDGVKQNVAFKELNNGIYEKESNRHGFVKVMYALVDEKPSAYSSFEEKSEYQSIINEAIIEAKKIAGNSKILILTNKAIAEKNGFKQLYKVFDDRYADVKDRIERYLRSIQALDVSDLCGLFLQKNYNSLIHFVRKGGYVIRNINDKKHLYNIMHEIVNGNDLSVKSVIEMAFSKKIIKQTETYMNIIKRNCNFLEQLKKDSFYQKFKTQYVEGKNTFSRIKDSIELGSKEEFDYYEKIWKKEVFIEEFFSDKLKFSEVLNYTKYLNEETEYITMHKTKGTSIPSVIVVMEEYFWNQYDFSLIYSPFSEEKTKKRNNSQKLIYVACSRARNNLICIRVLAKDELSDFLKVFPNAEPLRDYTDVIDTVMINKS
ncbi:MAG: AAA family ATPase [Lachnospiraceae bacterium]|nr:AAA family ATPase [Lachnospiraceae bacterium]